MLLCYGIGTIIGAGIYSIIGAVAADAGGWLWLSLLIAAVPAALAVLCYAELSTRFPRAGASYTYVREAFPRAPALGVLIGFLMAATAAATTATVSTAFAGYLAIFVELPAWLGGLALIAACTAVNIAGIRESAWVAFIATIIEVLGLLLIIGGALAIGKFTLIPSEAPVLAGVFRGAAIGFFVYTGFEGIANLAEETKRPERQIPRALIISIIVTTVLYALVAIAATSLIDYRALASSDSPLETAAQSIHPTVASSLAWIALFSTANTALITLVVAARLLYGMANDGAMPKWLASTLPGRKSPWIAALAIGVGAAALLPLGGVAVIGSVSSFLTLVVFAGVGLALTVIRRKEWKGGGAASDADERDVFRLPGEMAGVPVFALLLLISVAALATQFEGRVYAIAGGVVGAGVILAALSAARGGMLNSAASRRRLARDPAASSTGLTP